MSPEFCDRIHVGAQRLSEQLAPLEHKLRTQTGVYALEEGDAAMVSRAWVSDAAERSIDVQYFIFSADNVGLIAVDYLLRAADRGVQVRLLVDDFLLEADAGELVLLDAHPNLAIKIYNPTANIGKKLPAKLVSLTTDFRGFNQRMHNKTFVVDGKVVITGGRNIADEYFDFNHEYNFRDRDVLLLGRAVRDVQASFDEFWASDLSVPIAELARPDSTLPDAAAAYEYLHQYACDPANFWPQVRERIETVPVAFKTLMESGELVWTDSVTFVSDEPGKNDGSQGLGGGGATTDALMEFVRDATDRIDIETPYLVTTELSRELFRAAVERGVKVSILTNSLPSTDNLEAFNGYQRERAALLAAGVELYEFKPDAAVRFRVMRGALQQALDYAPTFGLHAKSMVIDGRIAVIGTFNLDPRSANLNTECIVVVRDPRVALRLQAAMEADRDSASAWRTTSEFNPDGSAGWKKRVRAWMRRAVPRSIL